ncbi:hypothetical protein [Fodinibius saliphilus]|uniref:hypothetical protein n=1 Tax=Fodinibius saliphilus TaxID=1920650 RepID=UPI001486AFCA|nr:hypothetical protein [Fodinibius saliphilus]
MILIGKHHRRRLLFATQKKSLTQKIPSYYSIYGEKPHDTELIPLASLTPG